MRPGGRRRGKQRAGQEERERGPLERRERVEHGPPERVEGEERLGPRRLAFLLLPRGGRREAAVGAEGREARGPEEEAEAAAWRENWRARARERGGQEARGLEEGGGGLLGRGPSPLPGRAASSIFGARPQPPRLAPAAVLAPAAKLAGEGRGGRPRLARGLRWLIHLRPRLPAAARPHSRAACGG